MCHVISKRLEIVSNSDPCRSDGVIAWHYLKAHAAHAVQTQSLCSVRVAPFLLIL